MILDQLSKAELAAFVLLPINNTKNKCYKDQNFSSKVIPKYLYSIPSAESRFRYEKSKNKKNNVTIYSLEYLFTIFFKLLLSGLT